MAYTNVIKYVEECHDLTFYQDVGYFQENMNLLNYY